MVNFNFGLGSDDTTTPVDPTGTQNTSSTDDAAASIVAEPTPSTKEVKSPTELVSKEENIATPEEVKSGETPSEKSEATIPVIETPKDEIENRKDSTPNETITEAGRQEDSPVSAPANPFEGKEEVKSEVKNEESAADTKEENTPSNETLANPFAVSSTTSSEEKEETKPEEAAPSTDKAPVNPFAVPAATPPEEKKEKVEVEETTPVAPVMPTTNSFTATPEKEDPKTDNKGSMSIPVVVSKNTEKKNEEIISEKTFSQKTTPISSSAMTDDITTTNDPMQAVGQVKNDIVAFVDFHKKNIQKFQNDISGLEKKIQEEKKLLKSKGDAYAKMLKELQDLTQNFGELNGGNEQQKQSNRPQHSQHPRPEQKK